MRGPHQSSRNTIKGFVYGLAGFLFCYLLLMAVCSTELSGGACPGYLMGQRAARASSRNIKMPASVTTAGGLPAPLQRVESAAQVPAAAQPVVAQTALVQPVAAKDAAAVVASSAAGSNGEEALPGAVTLDMGRYNPYVLVKEFARLMQARELADAECAVNHGTALVNNWAATRQEACSPEPGAPDHARSVMYTHSYQAPGHRSFGTFVAEWANVLFGPSFEQLNAPGGTRAACSMSVPGALNKPAKVTHDWSFRSAKDFFKQVPAGDVATACAPGSKTVVEHPVMMVWRTDTTNAFHTMEDLMTYFMALAVLKDSTILQQPIQVVLVDDKALGYYPELWQRISHPHPVRFLKDDPYPAGTCFRRAIVASSRPSFLEFEVSMGSPASCKSAVHSAMSAWLQRELFPELFATQPRPFPVALQGGVVTSTITWISRRNYEAMAAGRFTGWQRSRIVGNEADLLASMHRAVLDWNDQACFRQDSKAGCRDVKVVFRLEEIELSDSPFFPDQLVQFAHTDILVCTHGAGAGNVIWLRPFRGALLEIMHHASGQFHYHNMAVNMGMLYTSVSGSTGQNVAVDNVVKALTKLMDDMVERVAA